MHALRHTYATRLPGVTHTRHVETAACIIDGAPMAWIDWDAIITALDGGRCQHPAGAAHRGQLRRQQLQREIHEGLNMVESWNRANAVIFYGKGGDLASNHRDEQEMSVLCLRILPAARWST